MRTTEPTETELADLWSEYKESASERVREALILNYSPLVKYVASRLAVGLPQNVEQADLVSYGMFGLIDAIDKFEPERGYKFETYAIARIKGAILDELRSIDWVPRSVRSKVRQIEKAYAKLEARHHRPPSDTELATELRWNVEQLQAALTQISQVGLAALDEILAVGGDRGESVTLGDTIADTSTHGPMGAFEITETRQQLAQSINDLPEREKIVLTLYYYESLTLSEIGRVLGVTESRVCQIHTKAVLHLRSRFASLERDPGLILGGSGPAPVLPPPSPSLPIPGAPVFDPRRRSAARARRLGRLRLLAVLVAVAADGVGRPRRGPPARRPTRARDVPTAGVPTARATARPSSRRSSTRSASRRVPMARGTAGSSTPPCREPPSRPSVPAVSSSPDRWRVGWP